MPRSALKQRFAGVTLFLLVLLGPVLAFAADVEEADQKKEFVLPTVEVTADKRTTEAQKTPLTMDVITAQDIVDAGITSIHDVFARMPNMVASTQYIGGMNFMTYRGAHSSSGTETNPVVIYVDDVPMETFQTLDVNLANVERIEILRGAQGVIYGKNAFAGIIRIITKKPGNEMEGKIHTQVDSRGSYEAGATVSGPVALDGLFFSLTASHDYEKGYLKSASDEAREEQWHERAKGQLRYNPTPESDITLLFDYAQSQKDRPHYTISPATVSMTSLASSGDEETSNLLNMALTGSFVFENFTVESVTTERIESLDYVLDMTPISPLLSDGGRETERNEFTQELRIRSNDGAEGMHWLLGVYGSYSDQNMRKAFQKYSPLFTTAVVNSPFRMFSTEIAPFGQLEIPLTDSLNLTTGLRWHTVSRSASVNYEWAFTGVDVHTRVEDDWSELLPRVNLSYTVSDDKMVYAGVSRSFIPGGVCYTTMTGLGNLKYDSQTAWNYEVGAKTEWFGNRLRINPVLFYSEYSDLQEMAYDASTGNFIASNPGKKATAYGAELDMAWLILPGLEADASLGYTRARYGEYTDATTGRSYDGNRMLMSPEYTARIGLQYRAESGLFVRGDMNYASDFYWDGANTYKRSPVATFDARVGWESESFDVYLFGRNVFGARYLDYFSAPNRLSFVAETATFGLELAYRF